MKTWATGLIIALLTVVTLKGLEGVPLVSNEVVYIEVQFHYIGNLTYTTWVEVKNYTCEIDVPKNVSFLFIRIESLSPLTFKDIIDPIGRSLIKSWELCGVVKGSRRIAYVNITRIGIYGTYRVIFQDDVRRNIFTLISIPHEVNMSKLIIINPFKSINLDVRSIFKSKYDLYAVLCKVAIITGNVDLRSDLQYYLTKRKEKMLVKGVGEYIIDVYDVLVFGENITLTNKANFTAYILLNIKPIILENHALKVAHLVEHYELLIENPLNHNCFLMVNSPRVMDFNSSLKILSHDPILNVTFPDQYCVLEVPENYSGRLMFFKFNYVFLNILDLDMEEVSEYSAIVEYPDGSRVEIEDNRIPLIYPPYFAVIIKIPYQSAIRYSTASFRNLSLNLYLNMKDFVIRVTDMEGNPLPNASAKLFSFSTYKYIQGLSDGRGLIRFRDVLLDVNYTLLIYYRNVEIAKKVIEVSDNNSFIEVECPLSRMQIKVIDFMGNPLKNVTLELRSKMFTETGVTDSNGNFITSLIPVGVYNVTAYYGKLKLGSFTVNFTSRATATIELEVYSLSVSVKDAFGNILSDVSIEVYSDGICILNTTLSRGKIAIPYLPKGNYTLKVSVGMYHQEIHIYLEANRYVPVNTDIILRYGDIIVRQNDLMIITIVSLCLMLLKLIRRRKEIVIE